MVHTIYAVIETANWVVVNRPNTGAQAAMRRFLNHLTNEQYLTAAMLADAAAEDINLIRFTEPEDVDVADVLGQVEAFRRNIKFSFGHERGCKKAQCFTSFALKVLGQVRPFKKRKEGGVLRHTRWDHGCHVREMYNADEATSLSARHYDS